MAFHKDKLGLKTLGLFVLGAALVPFGVGILILICAVYYAKRVNS